MEVHQRYKFFPASPLIRYSCARALPSTGNYDSVLQGLWIIAFADPTCKVMCHLSSCRLEEVNYSVFPLEPENCWFLHPRNYLLLIPLVCLHLFGLLGKHLSVLYVIKMFNLFYHRKLANPHPYPKKKKTCKSSCLPFFLHSILF